MTNSAWEVSLSLIIRPRATPAQGCHRVTSSFSPLCPAVDRQRSPRALRSHTRRRRKGLSGTFVHAYFIIVGEERWSFCPASFLFNPKVIVMGDAATNQGDVFLNSVASDMSDVFSLQ